MRRILLLLVLAAVAILLAGRLLRGILSRAAAPRGPRARGREALVRDRVCNTFVPRGTALQLGGKGAVLYFCSEACRTRHLARAGRGATGAA